MLRLALPYSDLALPEKLSHSQGCAGLMAGYEEHTEQTFPMQIQEFCILSCALSWFLDRLGSHSFLQEKIGNKFHPLAERTGISMSLYERNISTI